MLTSTEFNRKLAELRVIASRLLVCTAFNEDGAHKHMAVGFELCFFSRTLKNDDFAILQMDELHFSERLADGLEARRLLIEEIRSTRKTIEQNMHTRVELWQAIYIFSHFNIFKNYFLRLYISFLPNIRILQSLMEMELVSRKIYLFLLNFSILQSQMVID